VRSTFLFLLFRYSVLSRIHFSHHTNSECTRMDRLTGGKIVPFYELCLWNAVIYPIKGLNENTCSFV